MFTVVKRDGKNADFNLAKISKAIEQAFEATGNEFTSEIIDLLSFSMTIFISFISFSNVALLYLFEINC